MAKQLKEYKRKQIKCLIVEDDSENIFKIIGEDNIKEALKKYPSNQITKIYNPTQGQKDKIYSLMDKKLEEGKAKMSITGLTMLVEVIPMLTDIKLRLDVKKDMKLINEIIEDPSPLFEMISLELNSILCELNLQWIEGLKVLGKIPDDIVKLLSETKKSEENVTV